MESNISASIFSLAKNNNGFFKSEKQAAFLIGQIEKTGDGCIAILSSGYHSCPVFASWDENGITKLIKYIIKGGEACRNHNV